MSSWQLAIFTHLGARGVRRALSAVPAAAGGHPVAVTILANGCTAHALDELRTLASARLDTTILDLVVADKAMAWNHFVHSRPHADTAAPEDVFFFSDGDVLLEPGSLIALARTLEEAPDALAAGGMPTTGRDRDAWRMRMVANATLAGGLYALRGSFVQRLRARGIRIPAGFIGEDWLVSHFAATNLGEQTPSPARPIVFSPTAGFRFDSLSLFSPRDYRLYAHRIWRYALREVQYEMLMNLISDDRFDCMPMSVEELYKLAKAPSRVRIRGNFGIVRMAAVQHVRNIQSRLR